MMTYDEGKSSLHDATSDLTKLGKDVFKILLMQSSWESSNEDLWIIILVLLIGTSVS